MQYRVTHHTEEFNCPECGCPIYAGEVAWLSPTKDTAYCSRRCAGDNPPEPSDAQRYRDRHKRPVFVRPSDERRPKSSDGNAN